MYRPDNCERRKPTSVDMGKVDDNVVHLIQNLSKLDVLLERKRALMDEMRRMAVLTIMVPGLTLKSGSKVGVAYASEGLFRGFMAVRVEDATHEFRFVDVPDVLAPRKDRSDVQQAWVWSRKRLSKYAVELNELIASRGKEETKS